MADETTTLLIDVKVSAEEAIKRQQELKTAIDAQKTALNDLTKDKKGAELAEAKLSEEYIIAESNLKNLNNQLGANQRVLTKMQGDVVGVSGAYAALNQKSAEAAQLAKDMAVAYGSTDARTIEAAKSAKALSDQLKAVDAATGQHFRNVGDYAGQIVEASKSINGMKLQLADLQTKLNDMDIDSQEFKDTKNIIDNLSLAVDQASGKVDEFGNREPKNIAKKNFEDTMVTVGILSSSINALSGAFGDNEATQAALTKATEALAISESVANVVKEKGAIIDTVVLVKEKALAVSKILLTNLTRIFGLTSVQAWAAATLGLSLLITGITILIANFDSVINSVKSFFGITNEFAETENKIKNISRAMEGFADSTQLATDRMKAEGKSDQEILNFKKKRYNEELAMHRNRYIELKKITRDLTDDEKTQLEESAKFVKDSTAQKYKFNTEQIAITRAANLKASEEGKKAEEEKNKKREENNKKRLENENKAEEDRIKQLKENADKAIEVLNYEIEMAKLKEQERLAGQKQSDAEIHSNKIATIQRNYSDELSKLNAKLENEQITLAEYLKAEELLNQQKNTNIAIENAAFDEAEAQRKKDRQAIEAQAEYDLQQIKFKNEFDAQQNALDVEYQQKIEAANKIGADTVAIEAIYAEQSKKIAEAKKKAQLDVAASLAGNLSELFGKETNIGKAAASAQVAIQTYQGAMSAWAAAQVLPAPFNTIVGAASVATTVALGAKTVKDIWAVKAPGASGGSSSAASVSTPSASMSAAANVTGGLVSRSSGQTEQAATTQAMDRALKDNNTTRTVLVTNDLTTALNEKVQLQNDNGL